MARRVSPRRVKIHRTYTLQEAADLLDVHKRTVENWVRSDGLPALTEARPYLIEGRCLRDFLEARQSAAKRPLKPDEFYCLGCRAQRTPDPSMVELDETLSGSANLVAICPSCACLMHRRISRSKAQAMRAPVGAPQTRGPDTNGSPTAPPKH